MVPETAAKIAELKGVTVQEVFRQTKQNTVQVYGPIEQAMPQL